MGTEFWWIFDALVIMIVVYVIYSNAKRGLTKVFVINIGYIVASFLAGLVAVNAGPLLYDSVAKSSDIAAIEEVNAKVDFAKVFAGAVDAQEYGFSCDEAKVDIYLLPPDTDQFVNKLYQYVNRRYGEEVCEETQFASILQNAFVTAYGTELGEKLPEYVRVNFETQLAAEPGKMTDLLVTMYDDRYSAAGIAGKIEEQFGEEPTTEILRMFCYVAIFAIAMVVAAVISAGLQNTLFFNVGKGSERLYGALFGIAETAALLILFTVFVRVAVMLGGGDALCFNDQTVANTKIFHYLYDNLGFLI